MMHAQKQNDLTGNVMEMVIRVGLVIGLVLWCYDIVKPFIGMIIWGVIIAVH